MSEYKICATPRCPAIVDAGTPHCAKHTRSREAARGTAAQRGYGAKHQALRAQWEPHVQTGKVTCWRCREPIHGDEHWDLGHDDNNKEAYRGPEHMHCNRQAAGQKSQR